MLKKDAHKLGTSVLTPIVKDTSPAPPTPPRPLGSYPNNVYYRKACSVLEVI